MNKIFKVYQTLFKKHGPQGWWPIINNKNLLCEYHTKAPTNEDEIFEIICGCILAQNTQWYPNTVRALQQLKLGRRLSKKELGVLRQAEIMASEIPKSQVKDTKRNIFTQNTNWKNVEKAIANLNAKKMVSIIKMDDIPQNQLAELIRPSGYFNQKAERLKQLANFLKENKIENLKKLKTDHLRSKLLALKGIGPETADSILLYAFQRPVFVIDAYTKRLCSKKGFCKENIPYHALQEVFHKNMKRKVKIYKEYHALMVAEGKYQKKKRSRIIKIS